MSEKIFKPISEKDITRAIVKEFMEQFTEYVESDCLIIGAGPSGLMAGKSIAELGYKVLIVERNNYLGGGFWIGGYLMNKVTVRYPANEILDRLEVPCREVEEGLFVADAPYACSKLISSACQAGVKFLNMTKFEDIVIRDENRIGGAVINWTPVGALPREITCVDPVAIESKVLIDATGHEASVVKKLSEFGLFELKGTGAMWVNVSEDLIVEHTSEIYPGLVVVGMALSTAFGLPRMGPTFGGMLLSGKRGGEIVIEKLNVKK